MTRTVSTLNPHPLAGFFRLPDEWPGLSSGIPAPELQSQIEAFQRERYVTPESGARKLPATILSDVYYALREWVPGPVRRALQRLYLRDWQSLTFPRWPVDTSVEDRLEQELLNRLGDGATEVPFVWFWPRGAAWAGLLTHDVETQAGLDLLPAVLDWNDARQIPASVQLIPEERYRITPALIDSLRARGVDVNLHGLDHRGNLFRDRQNFLRQAQRIEEYLVKYEIDGFRSPCMYRNLEWLSELTLSFDMSAPNVAHLEPQRGGCCTIFPFFVGSLLELPLTMIQDYALFHFLGDFSTRIWEQQLDLITSRHGLVSIIAHPDYLNTPRAREVYEQLLDLLAARARQDHGWLATGAQVNRWWRTRQQIRVVEDPFATHTGGWRLEGEGADQAALAFVRREENRLVYRLADPPLNP